MCGACVYRWIPFVVIVACVAPAEAQTTVQDGFGDGVLDHPQQELVVLPAFADLSLHVRVPSEPSSAAGEGQERPPVDSLLEAIALNLGNSRAEIYARWGPPDSVTANARANIHGYGTDSIFTVHAPGLWFKLLKSGYDGREIVGNVAVSDNRYLSGAPIRIGSSAEEIVAALGSPQERRGQVLRYECQDVWCDYLGSEVLIELEGGHARRILVNFYVD